MSAQDLSIAPLLPPPERAVGITTTVPVEIVYAAGLVPVDLNNVFISSPDRLRMVECAERAGFATNCCCWVKGLYGAARAIGLRRMVAVTEGDCSNTHALAEMLKADGVEIVPFAYPFGRDRQLLALHLRRFAEAFGATDAAVREWKGRLDDLRALAHRIDRLHWEQGRATAQENYVLNLSCSDFLGAPETYRARAEACLREAEQRPPRSPRRRLGLLGVPPICDGILQHVEERGAEIVFFEVPRQFTMPAGGDDLVEQYARFTYPYDVFGRIEDIRREIRRRRIEGVVHYVQSFCFRQAQDAILRRALDIPLLTLECDRPGPLDARTLTRLEAFLEMLA